MQNYVKDMGSNLKYSESQNGLTLDEKLVHHPATEQEKNSL